MVIQSYQPEHPALKYVETNDFMAMYNSQIAERKEYHYPPVTRLVKVTLKHPDEKVVTTAAQTLAVPLREAFPGHVLGPQAPLVSRIQNYYLEDFWIKLAKDSQLETHKAKLLKILQEFQQDHKTVRVVINVDA